MVSGEGRQTLMRCMFGRRSTLGAWASLRQTLCPHRLGSREQSWRTSDTRDDTQSLYNSGIPRRIYPNSHTNKIFYIAKALAAIAPFAAIEHRSRTRYVPSLSKSILFALHSLLGAASLSQALLPRFFFRFASDPVRSKVLHRSLEKTHGCICLPSRWTCLLALSMSSRTRVGFQSVLD